MQAHLIDEPDAALYEHAAYAEMIQERQPTAN